MGWFLDQSLNFSAMQSDMMLDRDLTKVTDIYEPLLISFFIYGLKYQGELFFSRPSTLMQTFALIRAYEARADDAKQRN